jgi:Protein of unknown function (DUF2510)
VAGAVVVALGCLLPYASAAGQSYHVFERSSPHAVLWFAVEPAAVIAVAAVIGVMLLRERPLGVPWAAVLVAIGAQTVLLFLGYVGNAQSEPGTHVDAGGWLGMLGSAVIASAGAVMLQRRAELTAGRVHPAGWYADPVDPAGLRYWSGSAWTSHSHAPVDGSQADQHP